jgi:uncharacterized repeat protein (TIGR01451 family)
MGWRTRAAAIAGVCAVVATGLIVLSPASRASTVQSGHVNYIGPGTPNPGQCPPGSSQNDTNGPSCIITTAAINVQQNAQPDSTGDGSNQVDCVTTTCIAVQEGPVGNETTKPTNVANCNNTTPTTDQADSQVCQVTQAGGSNTINANFKQQPTVTGDQFTNTSLAQNITQFSRQRFLTSQSGDVNTLTVNGTITQSATANLTAQLPVTHTQRTVQLSNNQMYGAVSNSATYNLVRSQTSVANGAHPTTLQDDIVGPDIDTQTSTPAAIGLAQINLTAQSTTSTGWNQISVNGSDTKSQKAQSLDLGPVTQTQGHTGDPTASCTPSSCDQPAGIGGTLLVNSGVQNPNGVPDVDIGNVNDNTNTKCLCKNWSQTASGLAGAAVQKTQNQFDNLPIKIPGTSPFLVTTKSVSTLSTDSGGHEFCGESANGHADSVWTGQLECHDTAGSKTANLVIPFQAQSPNISATCNVNTDSCQQGGTNLPVSQAQLAVRNVSAGQQFASATSPSQTTASPGDTVEYQPTFQNQGDTASTATNATLSMPIPSGTTFASCSGSCTQSGGTVTWSLGSVSGGQSVSRTLDVTVNANAPAGEVTSTAAGADDQEASFNSNQVTLVVKTTITASGTAVSGTEGTAVPATTQVASFTTNNKADGTGDYTASVNWGDPNNPTPTAGTVSLPPTGQPFVVTSGGHTYSDEGTYTVTTTITNVHDSSVTKQVTSTATIGDSLAGNGETLFAKPCPNLPAGLSYCGEVANFTDANKSEPTSNFTASIDWGDPGSPSAVTSGTIGGSGGSYTVSGSHAYSTTGTKTITVTISETGGSTVKVTSTQPPPPPGGVGPVGGQRLVPQEPVRERQPGAVELQGVRDVGRLDDQPVGRVPGAQRPDPVVDVDGRQQPAAAGVDPAVHARRRRQHREQERQQHDRECRTLGCRAEQHRIQPERR